MNTHLQQIKYILTAFGIIVLLYLLKTLSSLVIPLVLAVFISLLLYPGVAWLVKRNVPYWVSVLITIVLIFVIGDFVLTMITNSIGDFTNHQEELTQQVNTKLAPLLAFTNQYLPMDLSKFYEYIGPLVLNNLPTDFVLELMTNSFITLLYLIFILSGNILKTETYIREIIVDSNKSDEWIDAYHEIRDSIIQYMSIKAVISLLTGVCFSIVCWAFGVEFAPLWGFLAFLLNFIPNVGSLLATAPPLLLGWLSIESTPLFLFFVILLIAIQQVLGNVLEPIWMGKRFSLNTIVVLFGLVLSTYIWGIVGAILAVPILVFIKIILQHTPSTGILKRLMENHK